LRSQPGVGAVLIDALAPLHVEGETRQTLGRFTVIEGVGTGQQPLDAPGQGQGIVGAGNQLQRCTVTVGARDDLALFGLLREPAAHSEQDQIGFQGVARAGTG